MVASKFAIFTKFKDEKVKLLKAFPTKETCMMLWILYGTIILIFRMLF